MTDARSRRQQALVQLLRTGTATSQEELVTSLRDQGFAVTQATVSRDLDQIGAMRGRRGYALPDQESAVVGNATDQLRAIAPQWIRSVEPAGQLVVIRTPPGSAHLVGVALDRAQLDGAVGTICGDDTVFVATSSTAQADALAASVRALAGL